MVDRKELTPEQLASSSLLSYVGLQYPKYVAEPMHQLIATALEAVEAGKIKRLLINTAPQHGKTLLASEFFPAWILGRHPDWKVIAATFNQTRANEVGGIVRNTLTTAVHRAVFPDCTISQDTKSTHHVATNNRGHYYSTGIGGTITGRGANCLSPETKIEAICDGAKKVLDIETLFLLQYHKQIQVLSFDHNLNKLVYKNVVTARKEFTDELYEITTNSGNNIRATGNHRFFIFGQGYIKAENLRAGDKIKRYTIKKQQNMYTLWRKKEWPWFILQKMLYRTSKSRSRNNLCLLWKENNKKSIQYQKSNKKRTHISLLFSGMFSNTLLHKKSEKMHSLWETNRKKNTEVLFGQMQKGSKNNKTSYNRMSRMWVPISTENESATVLWKGLRQCSPLKTYDWIWEFSLQRWDKLCNTIQGNEAFYSETRQSGMLSMRNTDGIKRSKKIRLGKSTDQKYAFSSSYRRRSNKQFSRKSNISMHNMSCNTPQIESDTISSIKRISVGKMPVYDIQVEGTNNFFANEILVHNCFIVDDPIKDREDAESKLVREKIKEWYRAVAYTRLRPDNRIIIIQTRWHCFHEDTLILTENEWKKAKDIERDDLLITGYGKEVIKKMENRLYSGDMYKFTIYGTPKPLIVTGNHKVLTADGWKYAEQLTKDDWLIVPMLYNNENIPPFEKAKKSKAACNANLTGIQNKVPKSKLKVLLEEGKTYDECAKYFGLAGRGSINGYVTLYELNRNTNTIAPQEILNDSNFWRIIGYWLAEGSLSKARKHYSNDNYTIIVLSIGAHEEWIADNIKTILAKYNIKVSTSLSGTQKTGLKIQFSCWQIAQYLKTHFGYHANGKQLPEWINSLPDKSKQELLIGYFRGDGCFSNKSGYRVSSVSLKLLTDVQRLLVTMNIPSGIMLTRKKGTNLFDFDPTYPAYISKTKEAYELRIHEYYIPWMDIKREKYEIRKNPPDRIVGKKITNNQLKLRIKKIDKFHYDGMIYDFETPSNMITAAGVTVHNSDDLSGFVLEEHAHENWTVLQLRAIAEEDDILGRPVGAALCPNMYDEEYLANVKLVEGTYNWESLYQQRPIPKAGGMVQYDWIKHYTELPNESEIQKTIISWDTAYKEDQLSDPTAATIWHITKNGYYLADVLNKKLTFPNLVKKVKELHTIHKPSAHLIEGRASGQSLIQELKQNTTIPVIEISTKNMEKKVRFDAITTFFESGKVWLPEKAHWKTEVEDQICLFPATKYDDIVDSVSQFLNWVNKPRYVRKPQSKLYWK